MITVLVHLDGKTWQAPAIEPAWLAPDARELFWLDLENPGEDDRLLLERTLGVHELVVEDALSEIHHPKIER
jgi:Mg2+ and Co2+ transporter CorA